MASLCKMLANPQWAARPATVQDQPSSQRKLRKTLSWYPSDLPTKSFPKNPASPNSPWPPPVMGWPKFAPDAPGPSTLLLHPWSPKSHLHRLHLPTVHVLETKSTAFHCSKLPKWNLFCMNWIPLNWWILYFTMFPVRLQKPRFFACYFFQSLTSETVALFMKNSRHFQAIEEIVSLHWPAPPRSNDPCPALFGPPGRWVGDPYAIRKQGMFLGMYSFTSKPNPFHPAIQIEKKHKSSQLCYHSTFHYVQLPKAYIAALCSATTPQNYSTKSSSIGLELNVLSQLGFIWSSKTNMLQFMTDFCHLIVCTGIYIYIYLAFSHRICRSRAYRPTLTLESLHVGKNPQLHQHLVDSLGGEAQETYTARAVNPKLDIRINLSSWVSWIKTSWEKLVSKIGKK